ncbi:MAG: hypothetical protein Q4G28_02075 [Neisseria sp.]|nr:hypothetical protein [Neisseria sp.]
MDDNNDFQKLDDFVVASRRNGQPLLRIGFQIQLYLRGGQNRTVRYRVADVLAGFAGAASRSVTHYQKHMARRMSPIAEADLAALLYAEADRLDPQTDAWAPHVNDGQMPPRWQGAALLQPGQAMPVNLSMLHLATPATLVKQDADDLIARITG